MARSRSLRTIRADDTHPATARLCITQPKLARLRRRPRFDLISRDFSSTPHAETAGATSSARVQRRAGVASWHTGLLACLGRAAFQLLRQAHLSDDSLMMVRQRVIVIALFAWLPLLVLSALEGQLLGGSAVVPFLLRRGSSYPLPGGAAPVDRCRAGGAPAHASAAAAIPGTPFDSRRTRCRGSTPLIASAFRLRNSVLAEMLLIAFVYGVGILIVWRQYIALDTATWYATPSADGSKLSLAGMWYGYVSLPIFQFLLIRWYFRLFIWTRFLWQVSRIELSLIPTHPDRVGGLDFLSNTVYAFAVLAVAHGALLAGPLANRIFFVGAELLQFKAEIAVVVVLMLCMVLRPTAGVRAAACSGEAEGPARIRNAGRALRARVRCQMAARRCACR